MWGKGEQGGLPSLQVQVHFPKEKHPRALRDVRYVHIQSRQSGGDGGSAEGPTWGPPSLAAWEKKVAVERTTTTSGHSQWPLLLGINALLDGVA